MSNQNTALQTQPEIPAAHPALTRQTNVMEVVSQLDGLRHLGATLVKSGMLPDSIRSPEAAVAIMIKGQELGIDVMEAFSGINVIKGKPTVSPQLMMALAERSGALENHELSDDGETATCTVKRRSRAPYTATFSMKDAADMGLAGKDNWKKQPKVMRGWRAVSAAFRMTFPDVLAGIYIPDEMGAQVDDEGTIAIDAEVITTPSTNGHTSTATEPAMPPVEPEEIKPWMETADGMKYVPHFDKWLSDLGGDTYNGILREEGCITRADIVSEEVAKRIVGAMRTAVAEQRAPWAKPEDADEDEVVQTPNAESKGGWPEENHGMPPALLQEDDSSLTGMVDGQPD
jgi:hypothetical protein